MPFTSEAIRADHVTERFDSGQPALDQWLREHALSVDARRTGRTFVWHDQGVVAAYYTITAHLLVRGDLPRAIGRGNPVQIPAVLLARLALDKSRHGQGLGGALLADALGRIVVATLTVAARFVVVDAIDEAAHAFYEHHGFQGIPGTMRLLQKLNDIARALEP